MLWRFMFLTLLFATVCPAASLSTQGHAAGVPDRAVVMLFLRVEAHPDGSEQLSLENSWTQAKTWLNNFGIKDEQITQRPLVTRFFQDQKRYALKRIAITIKLDPAKPDEDLHTLAQLVDQAAARGLLPVSQLVMLAQEQEAFQPANIPDTLNHFIFFLPPDAQKLADDAMRDGIKTLHQDSARIAAAAHLNPPRLREVHIDSTVLQPTDLKAGQLGLASTTFGNIHAYVPITVDFDPITVTSAVTQAINVSGTAHLLLSPQLATIQSRVSCPDASLQKALALIADKTRQYQEKAQADGGAVEVGGIAFFSGNPGMGSAEPVEGAVPAGVYRDVRITLLRHDDEPELAFKKRIEKLAGSLHPGATPENPNLNDNPFFQVTWTSKDCATHLAQAAAQAITDATANGRRVAALIPGKLSDIIDIDSTVTENPIPAMSTGQNTFSTLPPLPDHLAAVHLDESPALTISVTVKFGAEMP